MHNVVDGDGHAAIWTSGVDPASALASHPDPFYACQKTGTGSSGAGLLACIEGGDGNYGFLDCPCRLLLMSPKPCLFAYTHWDSF